MLAPVLELITNPEALAGTDDPCRTYTLSSQILAANGDARAKQVLEMGKALVREHAEKISDPLLRRSFQEANERFTNSGSRSTSIRK